jgi:hypothetical protein
LWFRSNLCACADGYAGGRNGSIDAERRRINCPAVEKMERKRDDGKAIV